MMLREKSIHNIGRVSQSLLYRWRWWIFGLLGVGYLVFELLEHAATASDISPVMVFEMVLLMVPLGLSIYLFEVLTRTIAGRERALELLAEKNRLILQLTRAQDWDDLIATISKIPVVYTNTTRAWLQVYDESLQSFQIEAVWTPDEGVSLRPLSIDPVAHCNSCCHSLEITTPGLKPCEYIAQYLSSGGRNGRGYCLPLFYGDKLIAMLCFALPLEGVLDERTHMFFDESSLEIASALEAARERRARLTSELANVARGERLLIARDLHDTLGQNLGYLHLKLDQFTRDGFDQDAVQLKPELERMRQVADEAYDLVRDALAIMHQDDDVRMKLYDLIEIHGKMVANRSNLRFSLNSNGSSGVLPLQIVRQIYYAVKEVLYNVERHAEASQVSVDLDWGQNDLTIQIDDDGCGFDPQTVMKDHHFGLDIIRGRIESCNGRLSLESANGAGTHVTMWLPINGH